MSNFVGNYSVIFFSGEAYGVSNLRKASLKFTQQNAHKVVFWDSWNASYAILVNRNSHSSSIW